MSMLRTRIIPALLLRNESLVKTVRFGKFTYVGDSCNTARIFNELEVEAPAEVGEVDLLHLDQALEALAKLDPRLAQVVLLRYFGGLSVAQTAEMTGTSPATVQRDWTYARAWLFEYLGR